MKKASLLFITLSCFLAGPVFSAPTDTDEIRVKSEVDKAFLTIGDPVTYTVTIEHAPDIRILSNIPAPDSDVLEIKKVEDIRSQNKKAVVTGRKFILTTYRLGEFILDPVVVQYRKKDQPVKTIQTNKLFLTVKSIAEGEPKEDIRDVKSVVSLPWRLKKTLYFLAVLALGFLGFWIYRVLVKKKARIQPETSPLPPEEEALMRLKELFESDLLRQGFVKLYYLKLSEILKRYFERRYNILAQELTTIEILRALRLLRLDSALYQKIQYVLEAADLAKFAKWVPTASEILLLNKKSEEIIQESKPAPEPPPTEVSHGV